mmetsp:Transcript_37548/g.107441  ORF Transcript_37548/g.107441 Transcript_37548/m.107441 type:complete len:459 (+) Transcript_37548:2-1378(+)
MGARTVMEGGAFGNLTREQVEMYCNQNLVGVFIECTDEFLTMDFLVPTTAITPDGVTGLESAFQILHAILTDFKFEDDALARAKGHFITEYDHYHRDLGARSVGDLIRRMASDDRRLQYSTPEEIRKMTLPQIQAAIKSQLTTDNIEVSMVGDFSIDEIERLTLTYLGTVPPSQQDSQHPIRNIPFNFDQPKDKRQVDVHVLDSDQRALVHLAGFGPNRWGFLPDGAHVNDKIAKRSVPGGNLLLLIQRPGSDKPSRRDHPAFARVALSMLQDIINKRMFSSLREEKHLTYDASFEFMSYEYLPGGFYMVTVHTNPTMAQHVLREAHASVEELKGMRRIQSFQVENARRQFIHRFEQNMQNARNWLDNLSGLQLQQLPLKTTAFIRDAPKVATTVQAEDLQAMWEALWGNGEHVWRGVGISGPVPTKDEEAKEPQDMQLALTAPKTSMGRRGSTVMVD